MSKHKPYEFRALLAMKGGGYRSTEAILKSPKLQEQCAEKRALARIIQELRKRGRLLEIVPANSNTLEH